MTVMPEPTPTAPVAGPTHRDAVIEDAADKMLAALNAAIQQEKQQPTAVRVEDPSIPSFEDGPRVGDAPPVLQPDSRIVPQWAAGIAVASIGVGAGSTGLGCASWLLFKGLSLVSVPGLERFALIIVAPFAGLAMAATAIGGAISKARAKPAEIHNYISGPVHVDQSETRTENKGVWVKNTNQQ